MNDRKEEYRAIVFKVRTVGGRDSVEFESTCRSDVRSKQRNLEANYKERIHEWL